MGRTALVTGASSGIGLATCQLLLEKDYRVVGIARDLAKGPEEHVNFTPWPLDLAQLDHLPNRLNALSAQHPAIDALVLCAGRGHFGHLEQFSPDQIRQLIDLDLSAQILCARIFVPRLKQAGRGDIIFLGSESRPPGPAPRGRLLRRQVRPARFCPGPAAGNVPPPVSVSALLIRAWCKRPSSLT